MMKQVRAVTVIVSVFIIASPAWTAPEGNEEYKRLIKTAVKEALREKILNVQPPAGAEPALETRRHLRTEKLEEAIPEKKPEQERTREKPRRGHRAERSQFVKPQSLLMKRVLKKEKSRRRREDLAGIIRNIDKTYGSIYTNLKKGKKLVIFFDPAHGKLANGQWQGEATNRMSATNRPEEFYSIMLSRGLYKQLSANRHIEVKSTPDFMEVLRGKKETYKNIPFTETVKMASQVGAFIILSEHLNNVSIFHKASGTTNLKGLHIVMDHSGRRILKYVHGQYSGFLTLYNKLDASGFSKEYALKLREKLIERNLNPNSWEKGAVGDDRFSYFVDFPISIIYESGFISHPDEEEELRDPKHVNKIVSAQYEALLETIAEVFGVDMFREEPEYTGVSTYNEIELLKLARVAVYYTRHGERKKAIDIINVMEREYGRSKYAKYVKYYRGVKRRLVTAERFYNRGRKYQGLQRKYRKLYRKYAFLSRKYAKKRRGQYAGTVKRYRRNAKIYANKRNVYGRKARKYFRKARRYISAKPLFAVYSKKYNKSLGRKRKKRLSHRKKRVYRYPVAVKKASRYTPIIFTVEKGETLKAAIDRALSPSPKNLKKLVRSFKKARVVKWKKYRRYSRKRKRRVTYYKKRVQKIHFARGIYIVELNRKLRVTKVKKVKRIHLNPWRYQNQEYLKNSSFARNVRVKAL